MAGDRAEIQVKVLRLQGELTLDDCVKIKGLLSSYLVEGHTRVVLNLDKVAHVHMSGLPVLLERRRRLLLYGGDLVLACPSPYISHILDLAGMRPHFKVYDTEAQAADSFA